MLDYFLKHGENTGANGQMMRLLRKDNVYNEKNVRKIMTKGTPKLKITDS